MSKWPFDVTPDTAVVTSKYVTDLGMPILFVSHEVDEEGVTWQFHCGNGDYDPAKLMLVRLDTILRIAPDIVELASLPAGCVASRAAVGGEWTRARE